MARPTYQQALGPFSIAEILAILASGQNRDGTSSPIAAQLVDASGNAIYAQGRLAADGLALPTAPDVLATNLVSNGTTLDVLRGNLNLTVLASAARTGTTRSATQTNYNARGAIAFLNVTVASGTGGLQLRWLFGDPVSSALAYMNTAPSAITTVTTGVYLAYPGASGVGAQTVSMPLPRAFAVEVQHGDGSSYTYSVGVALIA